ncbi:hypothetical protein [Polyangium jinanense]|uniref:Uncharacterized protein n=1 Tax=Polyangium jinanense TaxID=2829994 RepID=A0A9X3X240_9BACT|nr:hypothetical protein [Polyangium jinanense]MDC3952352.1 hypothetical protein [Polyangium jinanense]MDC3979981.1 hypothetical protein [Polyangium jinanense]
MTRRKKLFAVAIALPIAVAVGVGLKVRRAVSDPLGADACDKDLAAVFELCEAGGEICEKPPEGQEEACQAGCVMARCPNHVACTELDPIWCKPCEDEEGALHWSITLEVSDRCKPSPDLSTWNLAGWKAYSDCFVAETERRCPALKDKPQWYLPPDRRQ